MKREWYDEFRATLKKREMKSAPRVRKLMRNAYRDVAKAYSHDKSPSEIASVFLQEAEVKEIYRQIYSDVYIGMGRWNGNKYLKQKNAFTDLVEYLRERAFTEADIEFFKKRGLVMSANREAIIKVIETLRTNPEFMESHESRLSKMLMREFRQLSKSQAAKIVRTEATNAANKAMLDSTQRLFPNRNFGKEWVSAKDSRTRSAHRIADGQKVVQGGQFFVGGELLDHPGAGKKAGNNIYCRCAVIPTRNA